MSYSERFVLTALMMSLVMVHENRGQSRNASSVGDDGNNSFVKDISYNVAGVGIRSNLFQM